MIIDTFNCRPGARRGLHHVANELEIDVVMRSRVLGEIHQLDREIDALGGRVGGARRQDVFFPQDGDLALDQKPRALIGVGDDAVAQDDAFARLQLDFQGHDGLLDLRDRFPQRLTWR
jgi:hypothetical protein